MLALFVAVLAWLFPPEGGGPISTATPSPIVTVAPDTPTGSAPTGGVPSADVPESYVGVWQGEIEMNSILVMGLPVKGIDRLTIRETPPGQVADTKAVHWTDSTGRKVGCSRTWKLSAVNNDHIALESVGFTPENPTENSGLEACIPGLYMNVRAVDHDTIEISATLSKPYSALPEGVQVFSGTMRRQS
ncbi:hypothetical protein ACSDR0_36965 [Streptosporangium sp. G11]|uniref:hypothetical protein n=1 Tax=Streptosporangium sp. G11 TaxID=3436926 RepID=UPI003EBF346F